MVPSAAFLLASLLPIAAAVQAVEKPTVFVYVCGDETSTSIPGDLPATGSSGLSSSVDSTPPSSFQTSTIGGETSTSISIDLPTESAPSTVVDTPTTISSTSQAPTSSPSTFPPAPMSCSNPQLSCHNTTAQADLCCFNAPGGQLLLTQFWDTDPSTGPADAWTIHGLWPDHCDGTYDANCDPSREYSNITAILNSFGKTDLLTYMDTNWKDYQGDDESFWEHEWNKHGTCISTLDTTCYDDYKPQTEVADYFEKTVELNKGLNSYKILADAGITPSATATYTLAQIQDALKAFHGFVPTVGCKNGVFQEIWYHYNVRGSLQTGEFVPSAPGTVPCSEEPCGAPAPTGTGGAFSGKGFLQAYTGGANKGCLIGAGTWYTTGTCAGYTATASGSGFTLKSSKGDCGIVNSIFTCAAGVAASTFT
ncbi:Ribonuclease T2 precursor (RNase T2) [Pseudogymnoascus australis]